MTSSGQYWLSISISKKLCWKSSAALIGGVKPIYCQQAINGRFSFDRGAADGLIGFLSRPWRPAKLPVSRCLTQSERAPLSNLGRRFEAREEVVPPKLAVTIAGEPGRQPLMVKVEFARSRAA